MCSRRMLPATLGYIVTHDVRRASQRDLHRLLRTAASKAQVVAERSYIDQGIQDQATVDAIATCARAYVALDMP